MSAHNLRNNRGHNKVNDTDFRKQKHNVGHLWVQNSSECWGHIRNVTGKSHKSNLWKVAVRHLRQVDLWNSVIAPLLLTLNFMKDTHCESSTYICIPEILFQTCTCCSFQIKHNKCHVGCCCSCFGTISSRELVNKQTAYRDSQTIMCKWD